MLPVCAPIPRIMRHKVKGTRPDIKILNTYPLSNTAPRSRNSTKVDWHNIYSASVSPLIYN